MKNNNPSRKSKTLGEAQNNINCYVQKKKGKILDSKWRYIGKDKRKTIMNNNRNCLHFKIYELERGYNL